MYYLPKWNNLKSSSCHIDQVKHVLQVQLSMDDIETILNTLIYDGKVERTIMASADESKNQTKLYRAVASLIPPTGLMRVPCGVCPVSMAAVYMWAVHFL